jgi:hypothetical protein
MRKKSGKRSGFIKLLPPDDPVEMHDAGRAKRTNPHALAGSTLPGF